jgi:hypothetical protein
MACFAARDELSHRGNGLVGLLPGAHLAGRQQEPSAHGRTHRGKQPDASLHRTTHPRELPGQQRQDSRFVAA